MIPTRNITKVAVIGAGTMGSGIALEFARLGCTVSLVDLSRPLLQRGLTMARRASDALVAAGACPARTAKAALRRIHPTTSLKAACSNADLLVEAVSEQLTLKKKLFRQFDRLCPAHAILASNTSGLSITALARVTRRPHQVAGLHFWNPPHIMPLVEVTQAEDTDPATARQLMAVCDRMGKRPILVRHDIPGFVGNRLQFAVLREALHLLASGIASADDIDTAMTGGPGLRYALMGPLRTADLGGLDVFHAISSYLFADLSAARKPPPLMTKRVQAKQFGVKTGEGFYDYPPGAAARLVARRDRVLLNFLKVLKASDKRTNG